MAVQMVQVPVALAGQAAAALELTTTLRLPLEQLIRAAVVAAVDTPAVSVALAALVVLGS